MTTGEALHKFRAWIDPAGDAVFVDSEEVEAWAKDNPQPFDGEEYLGLYQDPHGGPEEPHNAYIQALARDGLGKIGHHGPVSAMGVPRASCRPGPGSRFLRPNWPGLPFSTTKKSDPRWSLGREPGVHLRLEIPLFISDMSFGALSEEAKIALAMGAERAGTGICSGEGGMLPEEQAANSRYFYELASGRFGWGLEKVKLCQAFHFKAGQGAKTGTGGHLPGNKVTERIAEVRGITPGQAAISPSRFPDLSTPEDFGRWPRRFGRPQGAFRWDSSCRPSTSKRISTSPSRLGPITSFWMAGVGRQVRRRRSSRTTSVCRPFRPWLGRAPTWTHQGPEDITLVITGGLRTESDFVKALALGADAVAISNSALQAIGCLGMRACHTNNCPVGIATQKKGLRSRLVIEESARRLGTYLEATVELMKVLARACGHRHLSEFSTEDLSTWERDLAELSGVRFAGPGNPPR